MHEEPKKIYKYDLLIKASYEDQKIPKNSIFDQIIKLRQKKENELPLSDLFIIVLSIAVGFFTAGTGTVAILAAATALTLSAYEAFKAYKEFEQARAANSVKFLSEEPTFFWVVVAFMGAKLDLKVLGKIGVKQALQTFQKSRHVKNLVDDLRRIGFSDEEIAAIRKGADNEIMGLTPQKINPELPDPPKKPAKTPKKPDEPPKKVAKAEEATQATARTEPKPEAKGKRTRKPKPAKGPYKAQSFTKHEHLNNIKIM
jgi:hypothetical protein